MVDFSLPTPDQNVLKPRNIIIDSTVESLSYYDYERKHRRGSICWFTQSRTKRDKAWQVWQIVTTLPGFSIFHDQNVEKVSIFLTDFWACWPGNPYRSFTGPLLTLYTQGVPFSFRSSRLAHTSSRDIWASPFEICAKQLSNSSLGIQRDDWST